jgi:hypothetical protein
VGPSQRRSRRVAPVLVAGSADAATSWARTTSSSTRSSGRRSCSARAASRRDPGPYGELRCRRRSSAASSSPWRAASSPRRAVVIYVRDVLERYGADPLRYYLSVAGPESATPTSPGTSSSPATTPSWSPAGATSSTARCRWCTERRRDPGRRAS